MIKRLNGFVGKSAKLRSLGEAIVVTITGVCPPDADRFPIDWFSFFEGSKFNVHFNGHSVYIKKALRSEIEVFGYDLYCLEGAPVTPPGNSPQYPSEKSAAPKGE